MEVEVLVIGLPKAQCFRLISLFLNSPVIQDAAYSMQDVKYRMYQYISVRTFHVLVQTQTSTYNPYGMIQADFLYHNPKLIFFDNNLTWSIPLSQGVKAAIAKSFERIHRSNLVGMGIIPMCFKPGEDADTLGLTGYERFTIHLPNNVNDIKPGQDVTVTTDNGKSFTCTVRFDTEVIQIGRAHV